MTKNNKTQFNEYGEIISPIEDNEGCSIDDLLKDVPIVNWEKEYGLKRDTAYQRVHTNFARKYAPKLLNLRDKILNCLK